ncbi:MAG: iron complex outermembrane receptor protein [Candidatus Azotimanducaceae bacterium]|jgi:iron complex outermembrane receptor protein
MICKLTKCRMHHPFIVLFFLSCISVDIFAQSENQSARMLEEVVVTGSRILRSSADAPNPMVDVGREDLNLSGMQNIADVLNTLPVFGTPAATALTTNTDIFSGVGQNLLDLRNLGASRTLVLLNGRRHVAGRAGTSAVDINAIPSEFIERVEIVTGGASAVYGSEAIAGVVNIITRKDLEGLQTNIQTGMTGEGDGENAHVSLTYGSRLFDDRAHFMVNASFNDHGEIDSIDRENSALDAFQNSDGSIQSPAGSGVVPDSLLLYPTNTGGFNVVTRGADSLYTASLTPETRFNRIADRKILLPVERKLFAGTFSFDISDTLFLSAEASYSDTKATAESEPVAIGNFWPFGLDGQSQGLLDLPISNPFIPAEVLSSIDPAETTIAFFARPTRLGNRLHPVDRTSTRFAVGLDGAIDENWMWSAYVQHGQTLEEQSTVNLVNLRKYVESINAEIGPDGNPRCISAVARAEGCAPYNIFGSEAASQASLDYLRGEALYSSNIRQRVAAASVTGTVFEMPAGEVKLAAGVEYRSEKSSFDVDSLTEQGLLTFAQSLDTVGEYDVSEIFAEVSVPLVQDLGILQSANVDAAVRVANYSTIGTTNSWNVSTLFRFNGGLKLRGTYSEATRAPNIGELFLPQSGAAGRVADPCDGGGSVSGLTSEAAALRIANCSALGVDATFVADQLSLESVFGLQGGNPGLSEETAVTTTVGFVLSPDSLPGFSASVDWWDISIDDAIGSIARQVTVDQCVDQPNTTNQFCGNTVRDTTSLQIRAVNTLTQNLASENISGVDTELQWNFEIPSGSNLGVRLLATYLLEDEQQQFSGSTVRDQLDEIGRPQLKAMSEIRYNRGPYTLNLTTRFIDSAIKDKNVSSQSNDISSMTYTDIQFRYAFSEGTEAYFGIDNAFDKDAPQIASPHPRADLSSQTASNIYDPIGRAFYVGANVRLGQ